MSSIKDKAKSLLGKAKNFESHHDRLPDILSKFRDITELFESGYYKKMIVGELERNYMQINEMAEKLGFEQQEDAMLKEKLALNTFIKLIRSGDSLSSRLKLILAKNSLTESQFNVLDALYHLGHLTQKELGKKLLRSGGNITMVIDNLEKQRLVERKRGEKDRRTFTIHLTGKGRHKIKLVMPGIVKFINEEMNILTSKEQLELQKMCKAIGLNKK